MYKSICAYQSNNDGVLSFPIGKVFNLIEQLDEHWWSMQDEFGNSGLIPASYLEVNKITKNDVLKSIKKSVDCIKTIAQSHHRKLNETERRNVVKLNEAYEDISKGDSLWTNAPLSPNAQSAIPNQPKRQAPKAPISPTSQTSPTHSESFASTSSTKKRSKSTKRHSAPPPPSETKTSSKRSPQSPRSPVASSQTYNIQISQGDAVLPDAKNIMSPLRSLTLKDKENDEGSSTKVTSMQGTNLTITRTENVMDEDDQRSLSNLSIDSASTGSFVSGTTATTRTGFSDVADRPCAIAGHSGIRGFEVSEAFGQDLVDKVRGRCKISFNKSLAAVRCVLQNIGNEVPDLFEFTKSIERHIQDERLNVYKGSLAAEDAQRLFSVLDQLSEHKEDSQQRNWAVHEDFTEIKSLLEEVVKVIDEIDPSLSKTILKEDEYRYINDLIILYQMEHRPKLRIALLHVFGCFCQLGADFVSTLLCSVLPTELAQDLMQDQSDMTKFLTTSLMLTMIFSTGEPVPYHHYVQFNDDFVEFVLNTIEEPPDNDIDDQVSDTLIGMLLSFNQHFKAPRSSTLIQVLRNRTVFRTLTEKILLLLNRETDPCAMFDFIDPCPDSVLKFLIDVFSAKETSEMFFTNDLYVLFDIILRQLVNREEKDKVRTEYLSLFHSILNTTDYSQHKRHSSEFKRRLSEILSNAENESDVDIYIVREILKRFGSVF